MSELGQDGWAVSTASGRTRGAPRPRSATTSVQDHEAKNAELPADVEVGGHAAVRGQRIATASAGRWDGEHGELKRAEQQRQAGHVDDACRTTSSPRTDRQPDPSERRSGTQPTRGGRALACEFALVLHVIITMMPMSAPTMSSPICTLGFHSILGAASAAAAASALLAIASPFSASARLCSLPTSPEHHRRAVGFIHVNRRLAASRIQPCRLLAALPSRNAVPGRRGRTNRCYVVGGRRYTTVRTTHAAGAACNTQETRVMRTRSSVTW